MEELRGARFAGNGDGRSSVLAGMAATARERAGEEGENEGVLTAESLSSSDGSGRPSLARIDGGDPWLPARKMMMLTVMQCAPGF